jgi:hypothetical protein
MRKGLFWLIPDEHGEQKLLTFAFACDNNGVLTETHPAYNSRKGDSFTHERSWAMASADASREIRSKAWNYYPRGRVEIKNNRVIVYCNPGILDWEKFCYTILGEFDLYRVNDVVIEFKADGSKHYEYLKYD